jgi:hypothetical protein
MRELRVQSGGRSLRVFYAFDPRRSAILLIGGDKTGDDRFYERTVVRTLSVTAAKAGAKAIIRLRCGVSGLLR